MRDRVCRCAYTCAGVWVDGEIGNRSCAALAAVVYGRVAEGEKGDLPRRVAVLSRRFPGLPFKLVRQAAV